MYGFKEKAKYFNELRNPAVVEADLNLLRAVAPAHPKLKMFARNPQRYADDILYTLLDLKSREEIRLNRRESEKNVVSHQRAATMILDSQELTIKTSVREEKNPFEIDAEIYEKQAETELRNKEKEEAEERAAQAEEQARSLEREKQELEEDLESEQDARIEAEDRAEMAEQALEEEKKKELTKAVRKNKSTKSTRKSNGKTSKTKTSK